MTFKKIVLVCSLSILLAACDDKDNEAPTASGVTITKPETTTIGQTLTGKYTYADKENDSEGTSIFRWLRDGAPIAGATKDTYVITADDVGKSIEFAVTPVASAGESTGSEVKSPAINIPLPPNSPPKATNVQITGPDKPSVGDTLTGKYTYKDNEGDAEGKSTFRWLRDGTPIVGATGKTYKVTEADTGAEISFAVTPVASTGELTGSETPSNAIKIPKSEGPNNTPPTATNVKITGVRITGTPSVGNTLTGEYTYKDDDGDAEGKSIFRWLRNDVIIPDATEKTYAVTDLDVGTNIKFAVTPVALTGELTGSEVQSPAIEIPKTPPIFTLKCNATTDAAFVDVFVNNKIKDRPLSLNLETVVDESKSISVKELAREFNTARASDPTVKDKLIMPSQTEWDKYTPSQKMLYLVNSERCARGLMPFEGIDPRMVGSAQYWANYLSAHNRFDHGTGENSIPNRFKKAGVNVGKGSDSNADFMSQGENLARFFKGVSEGTPKIAEVEARSIYNWMYNDQDATRPKPYVPASGPATYGHRTFILIKGLSAHNDYGPLETEGLFGGALQQKAGAQNVFNTSTVVAVMHVFNPNANYKPKAGHSVTPAPEFMAPSSQADCETGSTYNAETRTCK